MNVIDILKLSIGAEHLIVGWIEHEKGTYALAYKNPASTDAAVQYLMAAAQNTRAALNGGRPADPDDWRYLVQQYPGQPLTWTSDAIVAEQAK